MECRRALLATFYFDLCDSYNLYRFLPHCAMVLWEAEQKVDSGACNKAIDGACFMVAQKMADVTVFSVTNISDIFSANEEDVRHVEKKVFRSSVMISTLRPDRCLFSRLTTVDESLHEHMKTFFNMTLVGMWTPILRRDTELPITRARACPQLRRRRALRFASMQRRLQQNAG